MLLSSNRIKYKPITRDDLEPEAVAFLNSGGGDMFIGIYNDGVEPTFRQMNPR
ncbi:MAG: ATP-binding protein [Zoogloeaceae bacterium]|jgi:hypothetical protein|nr:ATP-binding protein [Zoogloeaceae bacterium]